MRIAFISDIHANSPALCSVLADIENREIDSILCAGDVVGYNAFPNQVIALFSEYDITSVRGNHDEAVLTETPSNFNISAKRAVDWTRRKLSPESEAYLKSLGCEYREVIDNIDIYMTHGSPDDKLNQYVREDMISEDKIESWFNHTPDIIVLGHTHQQFIVETDIAAVVNPGSVGQPRDHDPRAGYAILDTNSWEIDTQRVEYDIDKTAERTQAVLPRKLGDRLYEGR